MSEPQIIEEKPPVIALPPTQDDLPCDDGIPMETERHKHQSDLLINALWERLKQQNAYVGGNMFVYFSLEQVRNQDFRGPDVFVVLDVPRKERKSWVIWEEGKGPDIVIELLSESTLSRDKTEKKRIYQSQMRVPEYFWYDPFNPEDFQGFRLQGSVYQPLEPDEQGRLISQQLDLALVKWSGSYREINTVWLRWATLEGELLPTTEEIAEQQRQRAEQQRQRAELAEQQLEQLKQQLRERGIDMPELD
ncbi:Uma2 family endonuclease [Limnoraphis robusta CCNP1315]|uniref:Uma2 family endonuclease n=2 Tax=Limnoraphis TaxID=1332112 RepID=A0ABU5U2N4_9CYAN|nr:Uma2 family endonuclease [Limnoraphis robusta]MEA5521453.1 Uma2 family endonuclease [Limnoraphis robusta CCNP1315]